MTKGEIRQSVCAHDCPSTCALDVELVSSGQVGRLHGAKGHPYLEGVICAKVARYAERVHNPDRLKTPLKRTGPKGSGQFAPIGWDEALDLVAERFLAAAARYGAETVWPYHYAGTMGLVQRNGIKRLRHVMGYSGMLETFCVAIASAGWLAGAGARRGIDSREMAESELVVVWGGNPVHTQVHVMNWIQKAKRGQGAKLVVIDPYRTPTAEKADLHLALRPGTDAALACAVMHVLFAEGFADRDYLAKYTDRPAEFEAHLASRGPAWAAPITGLTPEQIIAFARLYGSTKRSFLRIGYGFTRQRNGAVAMHAVSCLPAVTGAWAHRGGGALFSQSEIYGLNATLLQGLDARKPDVRVLDMARIGAVLTHNPEDLAGGPPVTAMLIQNTNPAAVAPDSGAVRRGLSREDLFLCVHEQVLTETALMADVVLPATTFLEHDDIYQASAHGFLQVARAVIPPLGDARPNHFVICELARRLGARHPGFEMTAWELIDATLKASGKPSADEILAMRGFDCTPDFASAHFLNGFGHPDGRFRFAPAWAERGPAHAGLPAFPDQLGTIDAATTDKPFRLIAAPARHFLNSTFSETEGSRSLQKRPTLLVHPAVCRRLGLDEGALVQIGNEQGRVFLHVLPADGMDEGTVVVESIWPSKAFVGGSGINTLVSAEAARPAGGAAFHDTAVWLKSA
ncbi:molybdopterin-dependent oxidoreductase [Telmatospirillum sp.]|uniref:molybdopterin-dependent oxidoreductase n=1 Tax=Telmatospirillum sp. TaxID=2079197 RepID=UPI0028442709|nr:molybdopterin-dependent oxidoreductase [Telmatospirillum sp.]MDR3438805.1 molybdopterin-dependent oxidoreductase [Telmatospirillum sp.]